MTHSTPRAHAPPPWPQVGVRRRFIAAAGNGQEEFCNVRWDVRRIRGAPGDPWRMQEGRRDTRPPRCVRSRGPFWPWEAPLVVTDLCPQGVFFFRSEDMGPDAEAAAQQSAAARAHPWLERR
jgi:hypothetical protein